MAYKVTELSELYECFWRFVKKHNIHPVCFQCANICKRAFSEGNPKPQDYCYDFNESLISKFLKKITTG